MEPPSIQQKCEYHVKKVNHMWKVIAVSCCVPLWGCLRNRKGVNCLPGRTADKQQTGRNLKSKLPRAFLVFGQWLIFWNSWFTSGLQSHRPKKCLILAATLCRVWLVLEWVTTWKCRVLLAPLAFSHSEAQTPQLMCKFRERFPCFSYDCHSAI